MASFFAFLILMSLGVVLPFYLMWKDGNITMDEYRAEQERKSREKRWG